MGIAESFHWAREIGLDRAFQFFVAMTRMLIRLHRHKKLKPPSEAQFDKPKQRGLPREIFNFLIIIVSGWVLRCGWFLLLNVYVVSFVPMSIG